MHRAALPALAGSPSELVAANAASTTAEAAGAFLGPLVSGLLITTGGAQSVFGVFGVRLVGAGAAVLGLPVSSTRTVNEPALRGALAGLRGLSHDPPAAVLLVVAGQYVVIGAMDILLMVVAFDVLGTDSSGPGLLASALGAGSVGGGARDGRARGPATAEPGAGPRAAGHRRTADAAALGGRPGPCGTASCRGRRGKAFFDVAGLTLRARARGALLATGALLPVAGVVAWPWLRRLDGTAPQPGPNPALLRGVRTLHGPALPVLEQLSRAAQDLRVPAGTDVVRQGEHGDRFFVVAADALRVDRDGQKVRRPGPGDSFGEIALIR